MEYEQPSVVLNGQNLMDADSQLTQATTMALIVAALGIVAVVVVVWSAGALITWVAAAVVKGAAAVTNVGIGVGC